MAGVIRLFSKEYFTRKTIPRKRTKPPIQAKSLTPRNASQSIGFARWRRRSGGGRSGRQRRRHGGDGYLGRRGFRDDEGGAARQRRRMAEGAPARDETGWWHGWTVAAVAGAAARQAGSRDSELADALAEVAHGLLQFVHLDHADHDQRMAPRRQTRNMAASNANARDVTRIASAS